MTVYTPATLAERWGCSERHVRNLVRRGKLAAFRIGQRGLRIRQADVDAWESGAATASASTDCNSSTDGRTSSGLMSKGGASAESLALRMR